MNSALSNPSSPAARRAERLAALAPLEFDPALPISAKREEIRAAIAKSPVVIVCGETGSGKTTQLPKILLELGHGREGFIGHTQPRRIAARAVATRLAEELGSEPGTVVGYKVRFQDRLRPDSSVKLMTDGILLAETQGDPALRQYDALVIDEAHERSLNIDFLLGYLKRLLEGGTRPDLKLVITSATIDAERFSAHFGGAPVIEVSGRMYPVEVRYRPVEGDAEDTTREEEEQALADAVEELCRAGDGDVLVFLPGEREIRDAAEVLRRRAGLRQAMLRDVEIVPLYGRLSSAEQDRVFHPGTARRVVLATNVAETSLTVPRIRYVVDTGTARLKRYSYRNKVEQLQVEPVSQAAARQRAGRCGRVANGICIRLYSEEDHARRPAYTDPELLRSSLASVILRATSLRLGTMEEFPFLDPPSSRAIADGYALLEELGAIDAQKTLTPLGRELSALPLDPRVGRMLIGARAERCLDEVMVIASALAGQDPRQRPMERAAAADEKHKRFADERSDFVAFLKLWKHFGQLADSKSGRKLAQTCSEEFLSIARLREWRDIHAQLQSIAQDLDWLRPDPKADGRALVRHAPLDPEQPDGYRAVHRALLTGLLGNAGLRAEEGGVQKDHYAGARGIRYWVHPSSWVRKPGRWIMAAELVETTRLYARTVAAIEPRWLEEIGAHLIRRHRENPHWEKKRAEVVAMERGTLYGLPVYVNCSVSFARHDPALAREVFLRAALVEGDYDTRAPFFQHNRRLVAEIERLEHKSRRPDILVDDALILAFYEARVPASVCGGAQFEKWRIEAERREPKLLFLRREDLMRHQAAGITTENFPSTIRLGPNEFALEYQFEPGTPRDGVTLTVPVALLNQVPEARTEWLVPGLIREKVRALAKSLPQRLRHRLGPLDEFTEEFVTSVRPADVPLAQSIARHVRATLQLELPVDAIRADAAPPHLHMNFRVVDEHGRQLGAGRNLAELKTALGAHTREILRSEAGDVEGEAPEGADASQTSWSFGDLPEIMELRRGARTLVGYPGLIDRGEGVSLELHDSPEEAREAHRAGVRRLFVIAFRERVREVEKMVGRENLLALQYAQLGHGPELKDEIVCAALDRCFLAQGLPMMEADFRQRAADGKSRFSLIAQEVLRLAAAILAEHAALQKKLAGLAKSHPGAAADLRDQLARLLAPGFLSRVSWERLAHYPRYLKAAALRLDKLRADPARDARQLAELAPLQAGLQRELAVRARSGATPELEQFRWLLEELRVSLFAQELRTPVPVSAKRLAKMWQAMRSQF